MAVFTPHALAGSIFLAGFLTATNSPDFLFRFVQVPARQLRFDRRTLFERALAGVVPTGLFTDEGFRCRAR
jgi:hypothetical protein